VKWSYSLRIAVRLPAAPSLPSAIADGAGWGPKRAVRSGVTFRMRETGDRADKDFERD
jgi:hypothetical protein